MRLSNSILAVLTAFSILLAAAAALAADGAASAEIAQPVDLNTDIVVEGDTVTLGHLFSGVGSKASTPIARAPEPGKQVRLPADWLARVARAYAIDWKPMSRMQEASLRRASQRIGGRQIAEAIRARIVARGVDGEVSVQLDSQAAGFDLPVTVANAVEVAALRYDAETGRFTANVMAPSADRPIASATISGRVAKMVEVPVLTRRLSRGDLVGERDIGWTKVERGQLSASHLQDPSKIVGMSARRSVQPDQPLRETDLEAPVLVAKNRLVTLLLETDQMRLTAQGRALQNGAAGEVVRVVNTKSNTTVTGVVQGDGVVSVAPNAGPTQSAQK